MKIVCSPKGIVDINHPKQGINDLLKAGFTDIVLDLSMINNLNSFKKYLKSDDTQMQNSYYNDLSLMELYTSTISPFLTNTEISNSIVFAPRIKGLKNKTSIIDLTDRLTKESIGLCSKVNGEYIVIRPKINNDLNANYNYCLQLGELAKSNNTHILIENQCFNYNGHFTRGSFSDSAEAAEFIDKLNKEIGYECFGICVNVTYFTLAGQDIYGYLVPLENRIKAVILSDCDGTSEAALLPFSAAKNHTSCTDWLGVIRGLRTCNFDGTLILDIEDTISAVSPILRPNVLMLAKSTAEYLKWQIELENLIKKHKNRVLFGAGNMCRNYMKCYGEKYPPLFTCDNNSKLWNTKFCGLSVESPEKLKEIPSDCAIFICNIYYREIEAQLREMGITNPIEYFNDEYLPRYEFKRIER